MTTGTAGRRPGASERLVSAAAWIRSHPVAVDLALAVAAVPLVVWSCRVLVSGDSESEIGGAVATQAPWQAVVIASIVVVPVTLVGRRAWPTTSFVAAALAAGAALLTSVWWLLPSMLLFLISLYSYGAYGPRHAPALGLGVAAVGVVVLPLFGFPLNNLPVSLPQALFHGVVRLLPFVVAAWSLGMFRRVRAAYVAELEERARRAEAQREERARLAAAQERARIAREMHDVVAHALSVMISQAQGGRYVAGSEPGKAAEALRTIADTGRQALADMRGTLTVLRGEDTEVQSPQPTLADLPALLERVRASGLVVRYTERGTTGEMRPGAELAVFRLVQESLTNILKHAATGTNASVDFSWSTEELSVTVGDDGARQNSTGTGRGLAGMRERLAAVDGDISTGWAEEGGFVVRARLPLSTTDDAEELV